MEQLKVGYGIFQKRFRKRIQGRVPKQTCSQSAVRANLICIYFKKKMALLLSDSMVGLTDQLNEKRQYFCHDCLGGNSAFEVVFLIHKHFNLLFLKSRSQNGAVCCINLHSISLELSLE